MSYKLLAIVGSRQFAYDARAMAWARDRIFAEVEKLGSYDIVLSTGPVGVGALAASAGADAGVRVIEFRDGGARWENNRDTGRSWLTDDFDPESIRPRAIVRACDQAIRSKWDATILCLSTGWGDQGDHEPEKTASAAAIHRGVPYEIDRYGDAPSERAVDMSAGESFVRRPIVFLDLETGGLKPDEHPIIEVAFLTTDAKAQHDLASYQSLVAPHPGSRVDPQAAAVNGYNEREWQNAPSLRSVLLEMIDLLPPLFTFAGHNPSFDRRFLEVAFARENFPQPGWHRDMIDTAGIARRTLKRTGRVHDVKLATLCSYYDLPLEGSHRALVDISNTREIYRRLAVEWGISV